MKADIGKLFKHAKKLQEDMQKAQEDAGKLEVTGDAGAGLVRVVMTGHHDLKEVKIEDSLLKEDKEMLEDLIAAAVNDASRKIEAEKKAKMGDLAEGISLPGGIKLPF